MREVRFTVFGNPRPQGSMRAFMPKGARYPVVTHSSASVRVWREAIAHAAQQHAGQPFDGPVAVELVFHLKRPKSLPKKVVSHTKKPDIDKLIRAALDATTSVIFADDSQVTSVSARKEYAGATGPRMDFLATGV